MCKSKPNCPDATKDAGSDVCSPAGSCSKPNPEVVKRGNITITVDRVKKTITMTGTQEYYGSGASQAYADRAVKEINDTWSGPTTFEGQPYTVTSDIKDKVRKDSDSPTPGTNQIQVVQTTDDAETTREKDPAYQPFYGEKPGYQHSTEDNDGGLSIAHEFGHSMGLHDEYAESKDKDGNRVTVPAPGSGLMGQVGSGQRPTPANFDSIITGCGLE